MKKILVFLFLLGTNSLFAKSNIYTTLIREVKTFIDTVKPMCVDNGINNVYILKISQKNPKEGEIHYTISYIKNEYEIDDIALPYHFFFKIDNEVVLTNFSDPNKVEGLSNADSGSLKRIFSKLVPKSEFGIIGNIQSEVGTIKNGSVKKKFYAQLDELPIFEWILNIHMLDGAILEKVDSTTIKKRIGE